MLSSRVNCERVRHLVRTCILLWCISISCWLADRTLCDLWLRLSFPYLHSFWHVFVLLACCLTVVLFVYFDAVNEHPELGPVLRYWPRDRYTTFGVPFVAVKCVLSTN